jgi:NADH:ubiquinone reductase (H+-translocating)
LQSETHCHIGLRSNSSFGHWATALEPNALNPGQFYPPTAQHAIRQAAVLANNIVAAMRGQIPQPFKFKIIGLLATIGRRPRRRGNFWLAVFRVPRVVAVAHDLPEQTSGLQKKVRIVLDWTLDLILSKDLVQLRHYGLRRCRRRSILQL